MRAPLGEVLLVTGDAVARDALAAELVASGLRVHSAQSPEAAQAAMPSAAPPQVVVVDLDGPEPPILALVEGLHATQISAVVLGMWSVITPTRAVHCQRYGVVCLPKPVLGAHVLEALAALKALPPWTLERIDREEVERRVAACGVAAAARSLALSRTSVQRMRKKTWPSR